MTLRTRLNPFTPNTFVSPGMFVGRVPQLDKLETGLFQARAGRPSHFLLSGERGIGKSSLLMYYKWVAEGKIVADGEKFNFLVIDTDVDATTTQVGLVQKIRLGLDAALAKSETTRTFLANAWSFLKRVETPAVKLKADDTCSLDDEVTIEQFSYTLAEVANRVLPGVGFFSAAYDGVLILIDEADNASTSLRLGSFLKQLSERLERRGCPRVSFALAGLPQVRDVLIGSHPSSLRLFDELTVGRLSPTEVEQVIAICLDRANQINAAKTAIDDPARTLLVRLSEGYPHFIQQFAYSAFARDADGSITTADVLSGALGRGGALEQIGDRYYRDNFYKQILSDNYRRVLRIMAERGSDWVTKEQIRAEFSGKETVLTNALKALCDRGIILTKEGVRGTYRLEHRGFAFWIKLYTSDRSELERAAEIPLDLGEDRAHDPGGPVPE